MVSHARHQPTQILQMLQTTVGIWLISERQGGMPHRGTTSFLVTKCLYATHFVLFMKFFTKTIIPKIKAEDQEPGGGWKESSSLSHRGLRAELGI